MSSNDILTWIVAVLAIVSTAWYFLGAQWNVRRAQAALRWLQQGLPALGEKTTMRWMGTTGVHLGINAPKEPFKSVEILILMEPRDVAPLWLLSHLQGRRDIMIFRAHLRRHARVEFDLLNKSSWSGKQALAHAIPSEWSKAALPENLILASEGPDASAAAQQMIPLVRRLSPGLRRAAIRRTVPHVEIHLLAPWQDDRNAMATLQALKDIGSQVLPS